MTTPTPSQIARTEKEYASIAGEYVKVEYVSGTLYAFCSELGTLRLFRKMPNMRQGFSENMNTFFFCVETKS